MFRQLVLLALLTLTACSSPDSSSIAEAKAWDFALSNPVTSPFRRAPLGVGDRIEIRGDSLLVTNEFTLLERKLAIADAESLPDSAHAFTLEPGFGQTLRVNNFYNKELKNEWVFEPAQPGLQRVTNGELTGKSFYVNFPGEDTIRVSFGYGRQVRTRERKENEFFASNETYSNETKSVVMSGRYQRGFSSPFVAKQMRGFNYLMRFKTSKTGFDRHQYVYGRRDDGTLVASYVADDGESYRRVDLPLTPAPAVLPSDVSDADFAERISTGSIVIDDSYPRVDSVQVAYRYSEDFIRDGGLEYDELGEVEFTLNEQGEFILFSRGRVVELYKWKLSSDRSYIHLYHDNSYGDLFLPILSYDDKAIAFRIPLKVKTREPRGMELESYCNLDAYVRVEANKPATSTK